MDIVGTALSFLDSNHSFAHIQMAINRKNKTIETINSGGKTAQIRIVPGDMRNKNQVSASEISDFVSYINDNKNNIIVRPTITSDIVPYIYKILNQEVSNELTD